VFLGESRVIVLNEARKLGLTREARPAAVWEDGSPNNQVTALTSGEG